MNDNAIGKGIIMKINSFWVYGKDEELKLYCASPFFLFLAAIIFARVSDEMVLLLRLCLCIALCSPW